MVGESNTGGRIGVQHAVADIERLAVAHPPLAGEGHLERLAHALGHEPVDDEGGVRARLHHGVEVAGVVDVVVADEHPADVLGLDDREQVGEVLLAVLGHAGVDDHRLRRHG